RQTSARRFPYARRRNAAQFRFSFQRGLERVTGIEPVSLAWKAMALPLSYTRAGEGLDKGSWPLRRGRSANAIDPTICMRHSLPVVVDMYHACFAYRCR